MASPSFERAVLELWVTSQVPLTKANLALYTGVSPSKMSRYIDDMISHGLLDVDSTEDGDLLYVVRGSTRRKNGALQLIVCGSCSQVTPEGGRCLRCGQLLHEGLSSLARHAGQASSALQLFQRSGTDIFRGKKGDGDKSLVVAGALGLLGPIGWLYSGAWKETVPAIILGALLLALPLVKPLLWVFSPIVLPVFALIGVLYASKYNRYHERKSLFLEDPS